MPERPTVHSLSRRAALSALCASAIAATLPLLAVCSSRLAPTSPQRATPISTGRRLVNSIGVELPEDAAPLEQQVYRIAHYEGKNLDVSRSSYDSVNVNMDVYEPLVWRDPDNNPVPAAADKWEVSSDGLRWTFYLRPGAKWSDGRPVTADDWVGSFRRLVDPALASPHAWIYYGIKNGEALATGTSADLSQFGVHAAGDTTLEIVTERPLPQMLQALSYHPIITPMHMVEKHGEQWAYDIATAPSNGPFMYKEWHKGKYMILTPNPHYNGRHKPRLEQVRITFVPQAGAPVLQMYKANELDAIHELQTNADVSVAMSDSELKGELATFAAYVTSYMFFNTDKAPFDRVQVRQAFSHAIDRTALTEQVMQKLAAPAYAMLPSGFPCSQNDELTVQAIQSHNPALAKQLLAEAGYANGQGFPVLDLWTRAGQYTKEAEAIQNMLKTTLGITVQPRDTERAVYMDMLAKRQIALGIVQWKWDFVDPTNFLDWWATQSRHTWKNESFNTLLGQAQVELDAAKRCALFNAAERVLIEDVGGVFLSSPVWGALHKPWVAGMLNDKSGTARAYAFKWCDVYIKKH